MIPKPQAQLSTVPVDLSAQKVLWDLARLDVGDAGCITGHWVIERVVEPEGEEGIVIMPASGDDLDGPTLVIWTLERPCRVDELLWDTYRTVARCKTLADGLAEVMRRIGETHARLGNQPVSQRGQPGALLHWLDSEWLPDNVPTPPDRADQAVAAGI